MSEGIICGGSVRPLGTRPYFRVIVVALAACIFVAFGSPSGAQAASTAAARPDWRSPAMVAAEYVKSLEPSMKPTTAQLATLITDMRRQVQSAGPSALGQRRTSSASFLAVPMVTYWNNTYWFGHWDVAMIAGLSAVAVVALLLTTGPIGVGAAWGIVGAVMGIIATAFFSGYCAYYVPYQHRGGTYRC